MRIGILNINKNSFPSFFYFWIQELSKEKKHNFVFISKSKNTTLKNCSFIKLPFAITHWFAKTKSIQNFFLENKLDACFVPESFKTSMDGLLLIYITPNGLIFKNKRVLQEIHNKHHIIISPWQFLNTQQTFIRNIFAIYPPFPTIDKANITIENCWEHLISNQTFLLCYGKNPNFDDIVFLLKAFSIFKKKQKTQMKLVLLWKNIFPPIIKKIEQYKYKDEVIIIQNENADIIFTRLIPKSYAYIFPFTDEKDIVNEHLLALAHGIPILTIHNPFIAEIVKNAGFIIARNNVGELADTLKTIYLNENLHAQLSKNARKQSEKLSAQHNLNLLINIIEEQEQKYKNYYFNTLNNETSKTNTAR